MVSGFWLAMPQPCACRLCPKSSTSSVHGDRRGGQTPLAQVFGLMDVASGLLVHADMFESKAREREMLANSMAHVRADDLLLLDRGFPSYWLFAWLTERQRHFCIRIRDDVAGWGNSSRLSGQPRQRQSFALRFRLPPPAKRLPKALRLGSVASRSAWSVSACLPG